MTSLKKLQFFLLILSVFGLFALSGCDVITGDDDDDNETATNLHPVLLNGNWGYIDNTGKLVIEPQFDEARDVSGNYAAVRSGSLWGFVRVDSPGIAITPQFSTVGNFNDQRAPAQLPGQSFGYINTRGEFIIEPSFDFATDFSEGLAAVRADGLWGYVNAAGNTPISPSYSDARRFSSGLAAVETFEGWVYINGGGEVVIDPTFEISSASTFSEDLAAIQTTEGWGFINRSGIPVITPKYSEAGSFNNERAWIREGDYVGYIDQNDNVIIEPQFNEARSFSNNLAAVRLGDDWYFIEQERGLLVIQQPFEMAQSFEDGLARVQLGSGDNARIGYINTNGDYIWFPTR